MDVAPHMLSLLFGIICGAIGVEMGFDPYLVYAMSIIIFGGASQIVFYKFQEVHHIVPLHLLGLLIQDTCYMALYFQSI